MSNLLVYPLKRGATLSLAGEKLLPSGTWSATAKVRRTDAEYTEVDELTVTLEAGATEDDPHSVLIVGTSAQTAGWPLDKLRCDIRFADNSDPPVVIPTDTFIINVLREITDA